MFDTCRWHTDQAANARASTSCILETLGVSSPDYLGDISTVHLLGYEMITELIPITRVMMNIQLNNARRVLRVLLFISCYYCHSEIFSSLCAYPVSNWRMIILCRPLECKNRSSRKCFPIFECIQIIWSYCSKADLVPWFCGAWDFKQLLVMVQATGPQN